MVHDTWWAYATFWWAASGFVIALEFHLEGWIGAALSRLIERLVRP